MSCSGELADITNSSEFKSLVTKRAVIKRKITLTFKQAKDKESVYDVENCIKQIEVYLGDIRRIDDEINSLICATYTDEEFSPNCVAELENQSTYQLSVNTQLTSLKSNNLQQDHFSAATAMGSDCNLKLPDLKCDFFTGEGSNELEFHSFITQFNNVIGYRPNLSEATKLTYLKTYLKGYALKTVQHLQISNSNYKIAIDLLTREFLDTNALVDDLLTKLFALKPKPDQSFSDTKIFINDVRCILGDLKTYNYDFIESKSANLLVSHFVFHKLPVGFKQELVRKLNDNYPSITDIFDNYVEVIRTLNIQRTNVPASCPGKSTWPTKPLTTITKTSAIKEISNFSHKPKYCKFCTATGHTMLHCRKYPSYEARKKRCLDLKMCIRCSSQKHIASTCSSLDFNCSFCNSRDHISALCSKYSSKITNNFCVNSASDAGRTFILPTVTLRVGHGRRCTDVSFLLDSGSQRSYVSNDVIRRLNLNCEDNIQSDILISTFIDTSCKKFSESSLSIDVNGNGKPFLFPFLINEEVNLQYHIEGLGSALANVRKKFPLSGGYVNSDEVKLEGLIGVDVIQCFEEFKLVPCLGGSVIKTPKYVVPFGNVDNFLLDRQLRVKYASSPNYDEGLRVPPAEGIDNSIINFALSPQQSYFDPIGSVARDCDVDTGLDNLFSVESLGISEEISDYDQTQIDRFNENITFINHKYNVALPWTDKLIRVKSNFQICKSILSRVVDSLRNKGIYEEYDKVIKQQLADDILEPVSLNEKDLNSHVFIPHRAVIKSQDQVTTKLRIVLNCSLKIGEAPSLNEAAYPGINLMGCLLELLLKIRFNKYLVMSDVKQAFLMIKLANISDRNKFTILWQNDKGELVAYRYKSLVFGFASSPFILNHVIKYHVANYPLDECSYVLLNNLYVDNLFFTGNDITELTSLYRETSYRMAEGGFQLRSWATNCSELMSLLQAEGNSTVCYEKVLGYKYFPEGDEIALAENLASNCEVVSKRSVLACISKIFDPLGTCLPVTVLGKIFLQKLWREKFDWDNELPAKFVKEWEKIKFEFQQLTFLRFPRKTCDNQDISLIICCDSSKDVYGFCCYVKSANNRGVSCNLLFSKAKSAPAKQKTIPTLELMSVFLAVKCLPSILAALCKVQGITICVDAQIVLSWVLTGNVKAKNVFANNRVKDICKMRTETKDKFNVDLTFVYILTNDNQVDLLTRGISYNFFAKNSTFWEHGPEYLSSDLTSWPSQNLGCLSEKSKQLSITAATVSIAEVTALFPINKFSKLSKLLRVTAAVFMFIKKLRRQESSKLECVNLARKYWIKNEQSKYFSNELQFLNKEVSKAPPLVRNLNLFLDEEHIIRSKGILDNCTYFSYDARNPVLVPKYSYLTELFVQEAHADCKHLGAAATLGAIRRGGLWIPQGRTAVRSVISKCVTCKKINSFAFKYPKVTQFYRDKVNFTQPFRHTGVDFTGHLYVKLGDNVTKFYVLVFTCLNIRAVHLELIPSMTVRDFLFAFIRFCNLYTIPLSVYSDNAQSFLGAMGILADSYTDNEFNSYLLKNNIRHIKIPLYSAWAGAAWERLIRTIKNCLYKTIGRKRMEYFELITLLSDIQNSINSRPLTYLNDNFDSISPNSFLKLDTGGSVVLDGIAAGDLELPDRVTLSRSLEKRAELVSAFHEQWVDLYLLSLRENARDIFQDDWNKRIAVGDVVLISSPNKSRHLWQMGRVTELLPGRDGVVRIVRVMQPGHT